MSNTNTAIARRVENSIQRGEYSAQVREAFDDYIRDELGAASENHFLMESYRSMAASILEFEDKGWIPLNKVNAGRDGFSLQEITEIAQHGREVATSNALLGRGLRLRNNHVFGRGFNFEFPDQKPTRTGKLRAPIQSIIDKPINQEVIFSNTALKDNNRILFSEGNLFLGYNTEEKEFFRIPIEQIINVWTYEDDPLRVKYFLRSRPRANALGAYGPNPMIAEWIPVDTYETPSGGYPDQIQAPPGLGYADFIPVRSDLRILDMRVNTSYSQLWGIPDDLAARPWAWAASEYLKDGSKVLKALATILFQVKAKTETAAKRAGSKVINARAGSTFIGGPDTEVSQVSRANAVDLYTGRPVQAMVATALDVSVGALTSDMAKGGSRASEETLSLPEQLSALSRQEDWAAFFRRIFRLIGAPDGTINFKKLSIDPVHRQGATATMFFQGGGIKQSEYRSIALELLDIEGDPNDLPEPTEFTWAKKGILPSFYAGDSATGNADDAPYDILPSQGNSGSVGSITDNNELRDTDAAGTIA